MNQSSEKRQIDWETKTDDAMIAAASLSEKIMADTAVGRAEHRRREYPDGSAYYEFWTYPSAKEDE